MKSFLIALWAQACAIRDNVTESMGRDSRAYYRDTHAAISPGAIFSIGLGVIFAAAVLPIALNTFFSTNTTAWDAGTVALWGIVPLGVIAVVVFAFMPRGGGNA